MDRKLCPALCHEMHVDEEVALSDFVISSITFESGQVHFAKAIVFTAGCRLRNLFSALIIRQICAA
jgi:hypothetical protein